MPRLDVPGVALVSAGLFCLVYGFSTVFWWMAGIFARGALVSVVLFRPGPLGRQPAPSAANPAQITGIR